MCRLERSPAPSPSTSSSEPGSHPATDTAATGSDGPHSCIPGLVLCPYGRGGQQCPSCVSQNTASRLRQGECCHVAHGRSLISSHWPQGDGAGGHVQALVYHHLGHRGHFRSDRGSPTHPAPRMAAGTRRGRAHCTGKCLRRIPAPFTTLHRNLSALLPQFSFFSVFPHLLTAAGNKACESPEDHSPRPGKDGHNQNRHKSTRTDKALQNQPQERCQHCPASQIRVLGHFTDSTEKENHWERESLWKLKGWETVMEHRGRSRPGINTGWRSAGSFQQPGECSRASRPLLSTRSSCCSSEGTAAPQQHTPGLGA